MTSSDRSTGLSYDDEASRRLDAIYGTPDVVAQRRAVMTALAPQPGEEIIDVGSGPGYLALELAAAVGASGRVVGVDVSESMLAMARARAGRDVAAVRIEFHPGDAARLRFPTATFDAAVTTQVLEYLPDVPAALAELFRVLRQGGRALVLDTDWESLVWHSGDPARMRRVLSAWEEHLADPHLPRVLALLLRAAGFQIERCEMIPLFNPNLTDASYSHGLIDLVAGFVAGRRGVTLQEATAWATDLRSLGAEGRYFMSLNRYLFLARKP
jgi:ubiquinone/menaquinone biosynthesis C-methylase UbiE